MEKELNTRQLWLRIAAFILAFAAAVFFFTRGVSQFGTKEEGYQTVVGSEDEEAPFYQSGIRLRYYFTGSSNEIKRELQRVTLSYSAALKRAYKLLDAQNEYPAFNNLASVNHASGEWVELDAELIAVLRDALERTGEGKGYSLFAGPVYSEWNSILTLSNPEDFDPTQNADTAERLGALTKRFENRLELSDTTARLSIDPELARTLSELESAAPVLDLNVLHDAYELELVAAALERDGFTHGYLSSDSGLTLSLSGQMNGSYALYAEVEGQPVQCATVPGGPGTAFSTVTAFPVGQALGFYRCGTLWRHPYSDAAGHMPQALLCVGSMDPQGSLVEACYHSLCLLWLDDAAAAENELAGDTLPSALWPDDGGKQIVATAEWSELDSYGFSVRNKA